MIDQALSWQQMVDQTLTWKDLDAIARKHNPRVHHCSDTGQIVVDRKLREQAQEILRKQTPRRSVGSDAEHMKSLTAIRSSRREKTIDRVAEYICQHDQSSPVTILQLVDKFRISKKTLVGYVSCLIKDERVRRKRAEGLHHHWVLWGR